MYCARDQIILCKVLLSGFILKISLAYKIIFISSLFDQLYQGRWAWFYSIWSFWKDCCVLEVPNLKFWTLCWCVSSLYPRSSNVILHPLWSAEVVPCPRGASWGSADGLQGRLQQNITRGMIPARGRQQMALGLRADRVSWSQFIWDKACTGRDHVFPWLLRQVPFAFCAHYGSSRWVLWCLSWDNEAPWYKTPALLKAFVWEGVDSWPGMVSSPGLGCWYLHQCRIKKENPSSYP